MLARVLVLAALGAVVATATACASSMGVRSPAQVATPPGIAVAPSALTDLPPGWYRAGATPQAYEMGTDASSPHEGHDPVAIWSKPSSAYEARDFATVMRSVDATPYQGKRVRLSGLVKAKGVTGWAGLWMRVDGTPASKLLAFDNMGGRPIRGTSDWTRYEVVLDVDRQATRVACGTLLSAAGDVWADGLALDIVDSTVARTDRIIATHATGVDPSWGLSGAAPADYVASADATVHRSGVASLSLQSKSPGRREFGTAMQSFPAGSYRGSRVRFSASVKADRVSGWAGLWMRVDGAPGTKYLAFDNMGDRAIAGTVDWTRYSVVLEVPAAAEGIALGILLAGDGHVWMDDVVVEKVSTSVPTTHP